MRINLLTRLSALLVCLAVSQTIMAQDAIVYDYRVDEKASKDKTTEIPSEIRNSPLFGKTINVFGGSRARNNRQDITETWHCMVAQKYHMLYRNYARNSCCISFDRRRERWSAPINEFYEDMDSCDYILLIGGHNDAEQINKGKGTLDEFKEGFIKLIRGFVTKSPGAKIGVFTPWKVNQATYPDITKIMIDVCHEFATPVFDCTTQSGIYVWELKFQQRYFQNFNDYTHLNKEGHKLFMNKGEQFLLGL